MFGRSRHHRQENVRPTETPVRLARSQLSESTPAPIQLSDQAFSNTPGAHCVPLTRLIQDTLNTMGTRCWFSEGSNRMSTKISPPPDLKNLFPGHCVVTVWCDRQQHSQVSVSNWAPFTSPKELASMSIESEIAQEIFARRRDIGLVLKECLTGWYPGKQFFLASMMLCGVVATSVVGGVMSQDYSNFFSQLGSAALSGAFLSQAVLFAYGLKGLFADVLKR